MADSTITFIVLAATVVLFVWNRLPVEVVAIGSALVLYATDVLTLPQAVAGFGDPTVVFIASLFVVSEGLDATGITTWAGQQLIARTGTDRTRVIVLTMVLVALTTAIITPNGAVASFVPVVVVLAMRARQAPSQLMMPVAFAAHAGSLLALTGTPVNVLVSDAADDAGVGRFGFFSFALVGVPLLVGVVAIVVLFGRRLLPERTPASMPPDLGALASTLRRQYDIDDDQPLIGRTTGVVEYLVPPRSELVGRAVFPGMTNDAGDLVILAVQRRGERLGPGKVVAEVGDTLLVRGSWSALERNEGDPDVVTVDAPDTIRRQTVPLGPGARRAMVIVGLMVVLMASGAVPPMVASLLAAIALVVSRVLSVEQTYRAISWTAVILVGGMIPLTVAMQQTGAADQLADALVDAVGDSGPYVFMVGLFLLTVVLGQLISNTATALILIPIAVSAAAELDVSPKPVLMAVTVAAAASFLTPVATPGNLMVMGPGGYRFGDYWKLGLPMVLWYLAVTVVVVPLVWPF
jgi:di/tricarboxylate transporter